MANKIICRNLQPAKYKLTDVNHLEDDWIACQNCGRPIKNTYTIENENKQQFDVGSECIKTLLFSSTQLENWEQKNEFKKLQKRLSLILDIKKGRAMWEKIDCKYQDSKGNQVYEIRIYKQNKDWSGNLKPITKKTLWSIKMGLNTWNEFYNCKLTQEDLEKSDRSKLSE